MKILVIDSNNLQFRVWASFQEGRSGPLQTSMGVPTSIVFGMLRSLEAFTKMAQVDKTICCYDVGGGSKYRKELFPHYKGNREYKDMGPYFEESDSCRGYFKIFGINQAVCRGIEADDIIGWLAKKLSREGHNVTIYSDDKDYYQLLSKRVKIYRPCKEAFFTKKDLLAEHGADFKPLYLPRIDALVGQEKDNIPGACELDERGVMIKFGFGPAKAKKLLEPHWKLSKVREKLCFASGIAEKFQRQLLKNWEQVQLSYKLARIRQRDDEYTSDELEVLDGVYAAANEGTAISAKVVVKLVRDLEMSSIHIVPLLKSIGVNIIGKDKQKGVKIKT